MSMQYTAISFTTVKMIALDDFFYIEPRCEKTGLRGFRPGPTQAGRVQSQKMARGL